MAKTKELNTFTEKQQGIIDAAIEFHKGEIVKHGENSAWARDAAQYVEDLKTTFSEGN